MSLTLLHYADVETAYDDAGRIGRLAGLIERLRDDETVVCGAGDNLGPGVLSVVTRGRQALDFFRAVEPAVDTFGNHDFDHGIDSLLGVVEAAPQTWVCANAFRDGERFAGAHGVVPGTLLERNDRRIGVVGVAHPETERINPNAAGVRFTDPIPAVQTAIDRLQGEGIDRTVVLSHLGDDRRLARAVDPDVVLGGHDHETLVDRIDGTLVCRPGGNARYLLEVSFDGGRPTATHHPIDDGPLDTGVAAALHRRADRAGLADVVGTVEEPIQCDMMACKRGESRLGNLITDAYRWESGADVAVTTGGGFRRQPPLADAVTAFDLVGVTPYDADLVTLRLDGSAVRETFRHLALVDAPVDRPRWHFGHVSGAELVWNDAADELGRVRVDGDPVNPTATYRLATSEFYVDHELFPTFGPGDIVDRHGPQYEAVLSYAREAGIAAELEGRISRPTLDPETVPERDWPNSG